MRATDGSRPNALAVAAYDGMYLIYEALKSVSCYSGVGKPGVFDVAFSQQYMERGLQT